VWQNSFKDTGKTCISKMENFDYQALVNEIINRNINMFETFEDWTKGAFAL
jgi:hypothetical protein